MLPQSQIETHLQIYAVHFVENFPCPFVFEFKSTVLVLLNYLTHFGTNFTMTLMMTSIHICIYVIYVENRFSTFQHCLLQCWV